MNNWDLVVNLLALVALLGAGSFLYSRYIEPSKYGLPILATLFLGGLVWVHVWAVLLLALDWTGVAVFDLYSIPGVVGWVVTTVLLFGRHFASLVRTHQANLSKP